MKKLGSRRISVPVTSVVAVAAAVAVGLTPTVSSAPVLTAATVDYLRGTNIGWTPTDQQYRDFISRVLDGTDTPAATPTSAGNIAYNAGFWPVSNNYIFDKTWNQSVAQGVKNVEARDPQGDVIFGLSQGAVVLSRYKAAHPEGTGNTFVLVENPSRPNGGILERFAGLYIPVLDISVSGATPDNGDTTVDVARQYDGWADFPTYPLNLLATINAIMGMIYVHGQTQTELTAADIEAAKAGGSAYYQQHGDTTYYLIRTPLVPLLMPLKGIVPDPILGAIDPVLRKFIEMGYNRADYSAPTRAQLLPGISLPAFPSLPAAASTAPKAVPATAAAEPAASTPEVSTPEQPAVSTVTAKTTPKAGTPAKKSAGAKKSAASSDSSGSDAPKKKPTGGSARSSAKKAS
ncbi:PE-PPE domain-containing protein [Mycolicibacterium aichiense]|uniref:PE-PPE domain-containing protein n=1 Tax=Mycolicibacterium aichiense TaxID=1799 RepID=UPI000E06E44F|nr:PE-PPE domain-containing protein [Mycolicibacterium aichiense]STZ82569.1 PE-PPE domain-containing protein [Mycolicibacterium aichiense]